MKVLLGVSGSIAAYKSADIINRLKSTNEINVVMTQSATRFITPLTLEILSNKKVYKDLFDAEEANVSHIDLTKNSDVILVAPATANIIAKMASGLCDDMLSTILVVAKPTKVIIAPAMNTDMYNSQVVQENIKKLKDRGVKFIEPREALLACNVYGKGALAKVDEIVKFVKENNDIN